MKIKSKYAILCGLLFAGVMGFVACDDKEEKALSVEIIQHHFSISHQEYHSPV